MSPAGRARPPVRERIAQAFTHVEDVLYVGIGVVLAAGAVGLLISAALAFVRSVVAGAVGGGIVGVLDQLLLILMMIEILYTVQVSFREHVLVPEPFVLVAMIAAVRRILVITAEFGKLVEQGESAFRYAMIELGLLTVMTGVLVACLVGLRKRDKEAVAERA
ncbi:MAG: phosphate-starvation-inducible PsiE family protein [Candidatus Rokuibacteriota bacterium]